MARPRQLLSADSLSARSGPVRPGRSRSLRPTS